MTLSTQNSWEDQVILCSLHLNVKQIVLENKEISNWGGVFNTNKKATWHGSNFILVVKHRINSKEIVKLENIIRNSAY